VSGEPPPTLVDASVARSFAVIGWANHLVTACGGTILIADGVHGARPDDPSELRGIRSALHRQAQQAGLGSGLSSRALSAVSGLDQLLALPSHELAILTLDAHELALAVRLQSRAPNDRVWRQSLGARARRLDAGEASSIAIAASRTLGFATDDEDALRVWGALTGSPGRRTLDLLHQLVVRGSVNESDGRAAYQLLQSDDLHNLGGPPW
jgi:hypothetical protein